MMSKGNAQKAYEAMASRTMNCAQSVLTSFCEGFGLNKDIALKIARGFGGGMGQSKGMCGAVTGAYMVLGLGLKPSGDYMKDRTQMSSAMTEFNRRFKKLHGSLNCTELCGYDLSIPEKAAEARQKNVFASICPGLVRDAGKILEDILKLQ
jgi:C_GCAxxG_C_C family probable redox protein